MNWLIILLCSIWGFNWVVMNIGGQYFPPMMFSALRFLVGSLVIFAVIWVKRIPLPKKEDWKWYGICGFLQIAYVYTASQYAFHYMDTGLVSVLNFTMPLWLTLISPFFMPDERLTKMKLFGVFTGIIGLVMVMEINPAQFDGNGMKLWMEVFVLLGAVGWAICNIIMKKVLHSHDKIQFTGYQMLIGAILLLLGSLAFERGDAITWSREGIFAVLFAGVLASSLAYVLWFYILSKIDVTKASMSLLLVPVVGVFSSALVFQTRLSWSVLIGIVLILAGIGIVNLKQGQRARSIAVKQ
ncbi:MULTISPECIES: DMT family transporter [Paenibacillus]|uniref:DMT family transporter n=1 Tax=Paenibacillus TaxID=44249 RepID=UPI001576FA7F|nr:EamA family transporter [Paenibacillus sp. JMULE4]NTZ16498.1 EamA/RhaT family transporter [Paenibacillus sp. JMULE4]